MIEASIACPIEDAGRFICEGCGCPDQRLFNGRDMFGRTAVIADCPHIMISIVEGEIVNVVTKGVRH